MNIESTETFLKKFDYNFTRNNDELMVNMPFSQCISIDFSQQKSINITNKLNSWNYLTGLIKLELKYAFFLNLILGIVISIGVSLYNLKFGLSVFIITSLWAVLWTLTYKTHSERFKKFLLKWNQQYSNITV